METKQKRPSDFLKKGWTQRAEARDEFGEAVEPRSDDAVSWCLQGAIIASGEMGYTWATLTKKHCVGAMWNDKPYRKVSEVIAEAERMEREYENVPHESSPKIKEQRASILRWRGYWTWDGSVDEVGGEDD